eukprot:9522-Rhodomonas_salina.2
MDQHRMLLRATNIPPYDTKRYILLRTTHRVCAMLLPGGRYQHPCPPHPDPASFNGRGRSDRSVCCGRGAAGRGKRGRG